MIGQATQLGGGPSTRYKLKQVEFAVAPTAEEILLALEEFHEPGWRVCGTSLAFGAMKAALWIFYERVL